jgi:uncharacterized membrane protein
MNSSGLSPDSRETVVELGRLANLSDGVFAVVITLLVLDIRLPDSVTATSLTAALKDIVPRLLVYLISFIVVGGAGFWDASPLNSSPSCCSRWMSFWCN